MSMQVIKPKPLPLHTPCTPSELMNWCWQMDRWWRRQYPNGYRLPERAKYEPVPEGDET